MKLKNNKLMVIVVALVVMVLLMERIISAGKESDSQLDTPVSKRSFTIELNIVGVLDAAKSHMISSDLEGMNGTILYLIDDGKWVKKGDVLVKFDRTVFEKEVTKYKSEAESYVAAVKAAEQVVAFEINQVEREIANAEYGLRVAELEKKQLSEGDGPLKLSTLKEEQQNVIVELKRYQSFLSDLMSLKEKGFENPSEISATKEKITSLETKLHSVGERYQSYKEHVLPALVESAKAKVQNSSLLLQQTKQGGKHKIAKANAALMQVKSILQTKKSSLDKAEFELSKTEIKAPFDGIVIHYETFRNGEKRKPREGDSVFMNQPILYLPDIKQMIVKTKAREVDLHKIKLGQHGKIVVDAYPDAELTGELVFIGSLATSEESSQSYEKYFQVLFKVNEEDNKLRPGMTCRVAVQAEKIEDVISVPIQTVFTHQLENFCYVKKSSGNYEKRKVITGRQNEDFIEIREGLQVGDTVSLIRQQI